MYINCFSFKFYPKFEFQPKLSFVKSVPGGEEQEEGAGHHVAHEGPHPINYVMNVRVIGEKLAFWVTEVLNFSPRGEVCPLGIKLSPG
jgi:hypothetical protein